MIGLRGSTEVTGYTTEVDSDELFHAIAGLIDPRLPSSTGTICEGAFFITVKIVFIEGMQYAAGIYLPLADGKKMLVHGVIMDGPSMVLVDVYDEEKVVFQRNDENDCKNALAKIAQDAEGHKSLSLVHGDAEISPPTFPLFID
ncbi:MAG TPA: hypothetical protein PLV59_02990 [Candidatus Dojkabacteria bacterium]|nr:hypothetical protein [Candidatus Dojkabacteria bacterium]